MLGLNNFVIFTLVAAMFAVVVPSCAAATTVTDADSLSLCLSPAPFRLALLPDLIIRPELSAFVDDIDVWENDLDMRIRMHASQLQMHLKRETPLLVELDKTYFRLKCLIVALTSTVIISIVSFILTEVAVNYQRYRSKTNKKETEVEESFSDCDECQQKDLHLCLSKGFIPTLPPLPIIEAHRHPAIAIHNDNENLWIHCLHLSSNEESTQFEPLSSFAINIKPSPSVEPEKVPPSLIALPVSPLVGGGHQRVEAPLGECTELPFLSSSSEDVDSLVAHEEALLPLTTPDVGQQEAAVSNSGLSRKKKREMKRALERARREESEKAILLEEKAGSKEVVVEVDDGIGWRIYRTKSSTSSMKREMRMRKEEDGENENVIMVAKEEAKQDGPIVAKWVMPKRLEVEVDDEAEEKAKEREDEDSWKWSEYLQMKKREKETICEGAKASPGSHALSSSTPRRARSCLELSSNASALVCKHNTTTNTSR